jgi:F5/8 type C domain
MSNHTRPASRFGNLIARSKSPTKKQYRYWVPGPIDPPEYTSMWLREVSDDKTEESCQDRKYLFESGDFNRRQIFASSSTPGFEPWKSHLGGVGWVSTSHSTTAQAQEWIMVDLLRVHKIGMIAIAGVTVKQETYWLSKFNVAIKSRWSNNWVKQGTVYKGNTDATTITEVKLKPPVVTRFIKIIPLNFHGHIGLRWTVFGCPRGPVYPPEYVQSQYSSNQSPKLPLLTRPSVGCSSACSH